MPQAVSIFPVAPSSSPRPSLTPVKEAGASKFQNALASARQLDSARKKDTRAPSTSDPSHHAADSKKLGDKPAKSSKNSAVGSVGKKAVPKGATKNAAKTTVEVALKANANATPTALKEAKTLPIGAVWDYYCESKGVPVGDAWLSEMRRYEQTVLPKRS